MLPGSLLKRVGYSNLSCRDGVQVALTAMFEETLADQGELRRLLHRQVLLTGQDPLTLPRWKGRAGTSHEAAGSPPAAAGQPGLGRATAELANTADPASSFGVPANGVQLYCLKTDNLIAYCCSPCIAQPLSCLLTPCA